MKEFRIKVSEEKEGVWMADAKNLPGSPPVGYGKTKQEAIGNLMIELSQDERYRHKYHNIIVVE